MCPAVTGYVPDAAPKPGTAGDDNFHRFLHEEKRVYVGGKQVMILPMPDPIYLVYPATIMPDGRP